PINQIAAVSVAEARVLTISPWDSSLMHLIEKAILTSDIGINPTNDGRIMRLVFPSPTEERRKLLVKECFKQGEEAKIAVRNVRRDAIDKFKVQKKNSEITEDDLKALEESMQKVTDRYTKEVDKICEVKNKEIMEI
ncbi:MAG: ribosome recycling factor, partial [Ruthenibacterium sp.]